MTMWDTPIFEQTVMGKWWKRDGTSSLTHRSIPRSVNGFQEAIHPETQKTIRYYPYKKEMTFDGRQVPTFYDVLYTHYFPRELNDDERVKYVALKSNRTEVDVAEEIFMMRKMKLFCAQSLRNKIAGKAFRMPDGLDFSGLERNYLAGTVRVAQSFGTSMYNNHSFESTLVYSPTYDLGDSIDMIFQKNLRLSLQYLLCDVSTNRSIHRTRLPTVKGECKYPLEGMEPCLYEAMKLRLAVLALVAKAEGFVTDHDMDGDHKYSGCIIHFTQKPTEPDYVDDLCISEDLNLPLAQKWLDHYYRNYVLPTREQPVV